MNADALRRIYADVLRPPGWLRWAAVAVVAGTLFYASILASPDAGLAPLGPLGIFGTDKWLHALGYAALAGTLALALSPGRASGRATNHASRPTTTVRRSVVRVAVLALVLAIGYGVGLELLQAPLPERYFSLVDVAANGVGAVSGVLGWRFGFGLVSRLGPR